MKKFLVASTAGLSMMVTASAATADGQAVYSKSCIACHGSGAANSPRLGDKVAWAPRIAKGMEALYNSALHGVPGTAMLPKGTCSACSEEEVKAAVDYMVSQSK